MKTLRLHPSKFVRRIVGSGRGAKAELELLQRYLQKFWEHLGKDGRETVRLAALTTICYPEDGCDPMAGIPSV